MNFLEAAAIAKEYKGARISRGESGLFVVSLADGRKITSPGQLAYQNRRHDNTFDNTDVTHSRLEDLQEMLSSLRRELEIANTEIDQLRLEVNNLKESIAKVPESEWERFESEQKKIDEARQKAERDRLLALVRDRQLTYQQLYQVLDHARELGIAGDDLDLINTEIRRTRPRSVAGEDFLVVHAKTDGQ